MVDPVSKDELKNALQVQAKQEIMSKAEAYVHTLIPGVILVLLAYVLSGGLQDPSHPGSPAIQYVVDGLIGGLLYVFVQKIGWDSTGIPEIMRRIGIGMVAGYVVFLSGMPDSISALSMGYAGIDMIEAILNRVTIGKK